VDDFIQALFSRGELDAVEKYLAPEFVDHNPTIPGQSGDRESMRSAAIVFRAAFPDWHSTPEDLNASGDKVVERFTAAGTHRGELMRIAPTGQTITLPAGISRPADRQLVGVRLPRRRVDDRDVELHPDPDAGRKAAGPRALQARA
jgi:hypothetical protein